MHSTKGFTIIEVMVVVAIIGILAAIALPIYRDYVTMGRITEATSELSGRRVQAEQFFQDNRTYVGTQACTAASGEFFNFSCSVGPTASAYTIQADGTGPMNGFSYTINEAGNRVTLTAGSGWTANPNCWTRSRSGGC